MCWPGEIDICEIISSKLEGNQQSFTNLGGSIFVVLWFPGRFMLSLYLHSNSLARVLFCCEGEPGGRNIGSGTTGLFTCFRGGLFWSRSFE